MNATPAKCQNRMLLPLHCPQHCQICERIVKLVIKLENRTGKLITLEK